MSVDFGLMWSVYKAGVGFNPGLSASVKCGAVALAEHEGVVHCVHHDSMGQGGDLWWTIFTPTADGFGGTWGECRRMGFTHVGNPVALASYGDKLYLAYLTKPPGEDFPVLMLATSCSDGGWELREFSRLAKGQPVLAVHDSRLHLAFHGFDPSADLGEGAREMYSPRLSDEFVRIAYQYDNTDVMYHRTFDGTSWSDGVALPVVDRFDVDLAFHQNRLHVVSRRYDDESRDSAAIVHSALEGDTWSEPVVLGHTAGNGRPALAVHDDMLYVAWATGDWSGPEEDNDWNDDWAPAEYDASIRIGVLEGAQWREADSVTVEAWTERPWTPTPTLVSYGKRVHGSGRLLIVYPAPCQL
ncbi:hypothetical protein [Embleya sp. NPDC059259]|uniref:hypothetical protein n=1 Tax=unclassified Embleya TaxID=2699296 RepID=UPI0036B53D9F